VNLPGLSFFVIWELLDSHHHVLVSTVVTNVLCKVFVFNAKKEL